jgi:hypothetical protein
LETTISKDLLGKVKGGAAAGLVGGFALFSSFIGIDAQLGIEPGTFYKMIGISIGLYGMDAIAFGFFVHMLTSALIGSVFYVISSLHRYLYLVTVSKGILAGGMTGLVVFGLFFVPIHTLIMIPIVESEIVLTGSPDLETSVDSLRKLITSRDDVFLGAIILHVLYGVVMGLFCGMMAHEEYNKVLRHRKFL